MDKLKYPKYTEDMNWYPDKPYELKHVYDIEKDKYVVNEKQCCYYSPTSKHDFCTHKEECIFREDKWEYYDNDLHSIVVEIKKIRKLIKEYEDIKHDLLNGEIVYHDTLDDYYSFEKKRNSEGEYELNVSVPSNFKNVINRNINNLKLDLRSWNRELMRIKRIK